MQLSVFEEDVASFLNALGSTAQEVADQLRTHQVKGFAGQACCCPVAEALWGAFYRRFDRDIAFRATEQSNYIGAYSGPLRVRCAERETSSGAIGVRGTS